MSPDLDLDLDIVPQGEGLLVRVTGAGPVDQGAISLLESIEVDWDEVGAAVADISQLLTAQRQPRGLRRRLVQGGQRLFDHLLGRRVKQRIRATSGGTLRFRLHAELLSLPWELLHDGQDFLCLRYAVGRVVQAEGEDPDPPRPLPREPLSLMILADPREDLPEAEEEGQALLDLALEHEGAVSPNLLPTPIPGREALDALRIYPVVHLAGHGEGGGWMMSDGALGPEGVGRLRGGGSLPALIFANACASSTLERWDPGAEAMARVLLLGGCRHFIGAICDLPDKTGRDLALAFYKVLWAGGSVGESLRKARARIAEERTRPPQAWAGYVLYGDPAATYHRVTRDLVPAPGTEGAPPVPPLPHDTPSPPLEPPRDPPPGPPSEGRAPREDAPAPEAGSRAPRWRGVARWVGALVLGLSLGILGGLDIRGPLSALDTLWHGIYQDVRGPQPFETPMVILGVARTVQAPRPLYADLFEELVAHLGAGPEVVALDTWFTPLAEGEAPDEADRRLVRALAAALERFPVVIALEPGEGQVRPPPAWLLEGVRGALIDQARARCEDPACEIPEPPPWWERLHFGHVIVQRALGGVLGELGHRIPFDCGEQAWLRAPPFAWRTAFPRLRQDAICRGGGISYGVQGERLDIPLDAQGRMVFNYRGEARWGGDPAQPLSAWDLEAVVGAWARGEDPGIRPVDLSGQIVMVGLGQADAAARDADRRPTPLGEMYGVEVQANAIEALRQGRLPRDASLPLEVAWCLLFALAGAWGLGFGRPRVTLLALSALSIGGAWLAWAGAELLLSPMAPVVCVGALVALGPWLGPEAGGRGLDAEAASDLPPLKEREEA